MHIPAPFASGHCGLVLWRFRLNRRIRHAHCGFWNLCEHAGCDCRGPPQLRLVHELDGHAERRRLRISPPSVLLMNRGAGAASIDRLLAARQTSAAALQGCSMKSAAEKITAPHLWTVTTRRSHRAIQRVAERSIARTDLCLTDFAALEALLQGPADHYRTPAQGPAGQRLDDGRRGSPGETRAAGPKVQSIGPPCASPRVNARGATAGGVMLRAVC